MIKLGTEGSIQDDAVVKVKHNPIPGLVGGNVAALTMGQAMKTLGNKVLPSPSEVQANNLDTKELMAKLKKVMPGTENINFKDSFTPLELAQVPPKMEKHFLASPHYNDANRYVYAPKGTTKELLAHEMGHAQDFAKPSKFRIPQRVARGIAVLGGPIGLSGGVLLGNELAKNKEDRSTASMALGTTLTGTHLAAHTSVLRDEAVASMNGVKALKALGHKSISKKPLMGAFGTYVLGASVPAGVAASTYGSQKLWKKIRKKDDNNQDD